MSPVALACQAYRAQPSDGHVAMTIGIDRFGTRRDLWLDRMLIQPLRGTTGNYSRGEGEPDRD